MTDMNPPADALPAPPPSSSLRRLFLSMAVLVVCGTVGIYLFGNAILRNNRARQTCEDVVQHVQNTLSTLKDAETGQRGYLLTGEERYLSPYASARQKIAAELDKLSTYAGHNTITADDVAKFRDRSDKKMAELEQTVRLRRDAGADAALAVVKTDVGKQYMDELRSFADDMVAHETGLLGRLREKSDLFTLLRTIIFLAVGLLELGFLFWTYRRLGAEAAQRAASAAVVNRQRELLSTTLGSIGDGVIVTDAQGNVTFLNQVAETLTGWNAGAATGRPCAQVFNIINESTREPVESPVDKVLRLGTTVGLANHTILIRRDGTETPIDDSGAPIRDGGSAVQGVVLVFRDFSEHKAAEADLIRAREDAEAANIAKDNFLATLSHELRTPLTPVSATLAAWESDGEFPPSLVADVQMMRRNVDLEARLIDDLLDLTRIVRGKLSLNPEVADVHTLIGGVASMYQSELNTKRLRLTTRLTADRHHVYADPARLQQVLLNILKNATKFTPEGGSIEVRTFTDETGQVKVSVVDSGIGMSPELMGRLFTPFEQGTAEVVRRYGGLGLGMAISKALMEAQGGAISAKSEGANQGSEFTITLPLVNAPEAPPDARGRTGRRGRPRRHDAFCWSRTTPTRPAC